MFVIVRVNHFTGVLRVDGPLTMLRQVHDQYNNSFSRVGPFSRECHNFSFVDSSVGGNKTTSIVTNIFGSQDNAQLVIQAVKDSGGHHLSSFVAEQHFENYVFSLTPTSTLAPLSPAPLAVPCKPPPSVPSFTPLSGTQPMCVPGRSDKAHDVGVSWESSISSLCSSPCSPTVGGFFGGMQDLEEPNYEHAVVFSDHMYGDESKHGLDPAGFAKSVPIDINRDFASFSLEQHSM